jgi:hypothetical protein
MISKVTENLYIGEFLDVVGQTPEETRDRINNLHKLGISNVVSLLNPVAEQMQVEREQQAYWHSSESVFVRWQNEPVPLETTRWNDPFKAGLEYAFYALDRILFGNPQAKVLVHCIAGIDRSPFVVARYLSSHSETYVRREKEGGYIMFHCHNLADAYKQIKAVRPFICEHYEWASSNGTFEVEQK